MPRKVKDPATDVIEYFETADLAAAKTVIAISDSIVKRRSAGSKPSASSTTKKPATARPTAKPATGPGVGPTTVGDN